MVTIIATLVDVVILLGVFWRRLRAARSEAWWYAWRLKRIARDGVRVQVVRAVVLANHTGRWGESPGFELTDGAATIDVPRSTPIFFAPGNVRIPAGVELRASFTAKSGPDDGPHRTTDRREVEGDVLIATDHSPRFDAWPRWTPLAALLAMAGVLVTYARELGAAGEIASVGFGLVLLADLGFQRGLGPLFEPEPKVVMPRRLRGNASATIAGLAIAGLALAALAYQIPRAPSWTIHHPVKAPLDHVDPALDGRMVVVTGVVEPVGEVADPQLLTPGHELLLERRVEEVDTEHLGREGQRSWKPTLFGGLGSANWQVAQVRIGAYTLDTDNAILPRAEHLEAARERLRTDHVEWLMWRVLEHAYLGGRFQISFWAVMPQVVTVVAIQSGSRLEPLHGSRLRIREDRELASGEDVHDAWPRDVGIRTCMWLIVFGLLISFSRARDALISGAVVAAFVSVGLATGDLAAAWEVMLVVVPCGLALAMLPRSLLLACPIVLALTLPIASVRLVEDSWPGYVGAVLTVGLFAVIRIAHGLDRSLSRG